LELNLTSFLRTKIEVHKRTESKALPTHPLLFLIKIHNFFFRFMGIGLSEKNVSLNRLPGWDPISYGYHGDDGNFFSSSGKGVEYGPTFTTGDVIGCGLNFVTRQLFFTKNGQHLGIF